MITAKDKVHAWQAVNDVYPAWQWKLDEESSERAGYEIYRDTEDDQNYVCDLGSRLEINLHNGRTVNVVIEDSTGEEKTFEGNAENETRLEAAAAEFIDAIIEAVKKAIGE